MALCNLTFWWKTSRHSACEGFPSKCGENRSLMRKIERGGQGRVTPQGRHPGIADYAES